jgi:hypothetical protein
MASQSVTKPTSTSTQGRTRHSANFPQGYGNLALKSCDSIIFHFSRFLLSNVSPVFKSIYEMNKTTMNDKVLSLIEDSTTRWASLNSRF